MDVKVTLVCAVLLVFTLLNMVHADLIWHNDEIPYKAKAKCRRGTSYYSNSITANDTDIDVPSEIESLLDYSNKTVCYYCVCSVDGDGVGCIPRNAWFCEYFREIRNEDAPRHRYRTLFQQDRPAYFRQLSYRLRRTMDNSIFELIEGVGGGAIGSQSQKCVPFVSVYTDCNEETICLGCTKCNCSAAGTWDCERVQNCKSNDFDRFKIIEDMDVEEAFTNMRHELLELQLGEQKQQTYVPGPDAPESDLLDFKPARERIGETFEEMLRRQKRSVAEEKVNGSDTRNETIIKFHNTVDELDEDTLKNTNLTGTLKAKKVEISPQASRRTTSSNSSSSALQIEHTASMFNPHAADNKIDTSVIHDDKEDLLVHHKIFEIVGNQSLANKDKDLSKLLVNEMKPGSETIGDKHTKPISNITFASENDTLTAVTFIAGNLLNKLWNMERDANENSMDTELIKHRTINNLLDLFKEPLNLRQELFLKNALEKISSAMENTDISNISICEKVEKLKKESIKTHSNILEMGQNSDKQILNQTNNATDALIKINEALDLIKKYERIQNTLSDLKSSNDARKNEFSDKLITESLTENEEDTLNVFGNILGSITKLLMPNKNNKKFTKKLYNKNSLSNSNALNRKLKELNLGDINISDKDKIILDYLKHIQSNPGCLLNAQNEHSTMPKLEGNILLNLSEFFKIKSMSDLLKLVDTTTPPTLRIKPLETTTEELKTVLTTELTSTSQTADFTDETKVKTDKENQFRATKDKLKLHLKTILQDLVELQNINGKVTKGKAIEISDALPCIYNLLNTHKYTGDNDEFITKAKNVPTTKESEKSIPSSGKITEIYNNLMKELKHTSKTRRTNVGYFDGPRPKSAVVWERTIKNMKKKAKTRRNMDIQMSLRELKNEMTSIENLGSNTYKSIAYLLEVPAAERLILLKTLAIDTNRYISVLKDLKKFMNVVTKLSTLQYNTIDEFVDNVDMNINLNEKIVKNLDKPKSTPSNNQVRFKKVKSHKSVESVEKPQRWRDSDTVKLSRDQILNQLIKNRIQYYIRMKEAAVDGKFDNFSYELAKKILIYLELGDYSLARDLFKIIVSQNKQEPIFNFGSEALVSDPETYKSLTKQRAVERRILGKEPLIQFEEPKQVIKETSWSNQDQLIKQLLTIQNLNA